MTHLLPPFLTPVDLPLSELNAARLDGELFTVAGSWCPVDAVDGPGARAAAVARIAPAHAVAERMTAAWIYGLTTEPAHHQFCVDVHARTHKPDRAGIHLREVRLAAGEITVVAGLPVTTALRSAVDLARWGGTADHRTDLRLIADLLAYAGLDGSVQPDEILPGASRRISFGRVATGRLRDALGILQHSAGRAGSLAVADPIHVVDGVDAAHGVKHPVEVGGVPHFEHEPADGQSVA